MEVLNDVILDIIINDPVAAASVQGTNVKRQYFIGIGQCFEVNYALAFFLSGLDTKLNCRL